MGVKDNQGYNTVGGGSDDEEEDLRGGFRVRGWADGVRRKVYEWTAPRQWGGSREQGYQDRAARCWGECVEEGIPAFTRGVAAGGTRQTAAVVLGILCLFTLFHWLMQPARLDAASLVPAPSLCASQDDMYDTASRMCKVANKYAVFYLKHKSWVQCAPNVPGYRMLQSTGPDWGGAYWYTVQQSSEVRMFYDTCIPECATDEDTYHTRMDLCMVSDSVLTTFLNGDGQKCGIGTIGEKAIRSATASVANSPGRYWYAPDASLKVRELLESCHGTCAKTDVELHDRAHCQVMNNLALHFLSGKGGSCDKHLPGFSLIGSMGHTKDMQGAFVYAKSTGSEVEQFYLSCMKGWDASRHGTRFIPHSAETVKGASLAQAAAADTQRNEWVQFQKTAAMEDFT